MAKRTVKASQKLLPEGQRFTLLEWQNQFRESERAVYAVAMARRSAGGREWDDFIRYLGILPKMVENYIGVSLEPKNDAEATAWITVILNYVNLAQWMDYLVPGNNPRPSVLTTELAKFLEPQAMLSKAALGLCIQLCGRQDVPELLDVDCPAEIWLAWEAEKCFEMMCQVGLYGNSKRHVTKDRHQKEASVLSKWLLGELDPQFAPLPSPESSPPNSTISSIIVHRTAQLSKSAWRGEDQVFRKANCEYSKAMAKHARYNRITKEAGAYELRDGEILAAGRQASRKPQTVGQEFVPGKGYVTKKFQKKF